MPRQEAEPQATWRRRPAAAAYIREKHYLPCSPAYLARLASSGGGPVFRYLNGRWPIYELADLDAWAATRISKPVRKASENCTGQADDLACKKIEQEVL